MKKIYVVLLLLISQQVLSQHVSSGIGKWKLGLNVGVTWQTADVHKDLFHLGYGATLEYALYEKRSSYFGFSLRGRFLQGKTSGYNYLSTDEPISNNAINGTVDTSINYSLSPLYLNNRTSYNEFSLEAMLKWNKLYQNHGILFYLYLGGGFTSHKVETDQLDMNGFTYDYSFINNNNGSNTVLETKAIQDGDFETELDHPDYNTLVFTPAVGVGLGFRITPGVDFAFEHKVSLPQTDLFDGQIHDSGDPSFIQDIYHYTSVGLIFSIVGGHTEPESYSPPVEPTEPIVTTPLTTTGPVKPIITIKQPITNTFNTPNCKVEIIAKIENVSEQKDITFYHNGNKVPSYKYFFSPTTFKSTVELVEGNNNFKIVAKNGALTDTEEFSLKCNNVSTIDICHKKSDGTSITLNIKESEWSSHEAHGDSKGACAEKQITICHNISGQSGKTQTINIDESKWAIHKSHGDYLGDCQEKKMIAICHNGQPLTINEKDWATHAAHGDIKGPCPQVKMITICHVPSTGNKRQTLSIPENEWIVHQAHGDVKGTCPSVEPITTICHKNANGTKTTMTVPEFRWNEHFSHGDAKGSCPESSFIICHKDASGKKQNISIYESSWATHAAHGDTRGACPTVEKQITICHKIPGQAGKTITMTIPESKWLIHKSHGDEFGSCKEEPMIAICHQSNGRKANLMIKESEWASHAAHGDIKGNCPVIEEQITICHNIPGQRGKTETITIPASKWLLHKSHGDVKGTCAPIDNDIQICHHSGNTLIQMTIKESQWAQHAAHGDTKGICPKDNSTTDPVDPVDPGNGGGTGTGVGNTNITICHHPPGNPTNTQTISIPMSAWKAHEAHGDTKGICPKDNSTSDPTGTGGGTGSPNNKITICHHPPGNPTNTQTIQISPSAWRAHEAHGDTKGACNTSGKTKKKKN